MSRPEYKIKDKRLEKLVDDIFYRADTPYQDVDAFEVSKIIEEYINKYYKS